jgi:hypothetical protein
MGRLWDYLARLRSHVCPLHPQRDDSNSVRPACAYLFRGWIINHDSYVGDTGCNASRRYGSGDERLDFSQVVLGDNWCVSL